MNKRFQTKEKMWRCVVMLAGFFLLMGVSSYASEVPDPIPLNVGIDDPVPASPGHGKAPLYIPSIWLDGYVLSFQYSHPAYTIYILEDGVVVYSVVVSSSTMSVVLPSWLSGEYEIQIYPDGSSYYFYGDITL